MQGIPPAKDTDAEDVVWGLQTAETLWKRGERIDAIVWLRRAAQAAGEANADDRAVELARAAAELSDWMASQNSAVPPPAADDAGDRPSLSIDVDVEPRAVPAPVLPLGIAVVDGPSDLRPEEHSASVPPAEKVHAGMFDPWAEGSSKSRNSGPVTSAPDEDEIVTSVRPNTLLAQQQREQHLKAAPKPPPLPPRARAASLPRIGDTPPPPANVEPDVPLPRLVDTVPPGPMDTTRRNDVPVRDEGEVGEEPLDAPTLEMEAPPAGAKASRLDLDAVEAFADLPDDARHDFAAAAHIDDLAEGEEVRSFALAYVMEGAFDVTATIVDAPAVRLDGGAVLRARGTIEDGVPMRLVCADKKGVVATWSDAAVEQAFRTCPWVEEDLRALGDRVQTLVGITIGPLGERLDPSIREQIVGRLTMRPLLPGEIVVRAGETVPGLLLVGVGELELVRGDEVVGRVGSGEFVFPTEVLGAGDAPATVRGGKGGALILFGARGIAHELLVTCPPLLEVFAGM